MSQQQNQPPSNRPQNPFSRPFGGSQAPGTRPGGPSAPPPTPPTGSRLGGLPRFGANRVNWRIVPVTGLVVRFDLDGLGDPFHRLLGRPLTTAFGNHDAVIEAVEAGGEAVNELETQLDDAWQEYDLHGAVLLYPWRKEILQIMAGNVAAVDDEESESYEDDKPSPPIFWRALDLRLVFNVLARTRSNILLSRAPLGLERQYLGRSLFTDDPRLITLARATGYIEEAVLK